ncbi:MAG TPA: hypothetical protein VMB80_16495 [Candidatus Acidoferrum sp.]|nr:hypothetical protein [Candidatus Acidoferrum sp.]
MMVDLLVGLALLAATILPLAFFYVKETRVLRADYFHAVAMEIVDGEMELLTAGEWRKLPDGSQPYAVHAQAAASLPPGHFLLTKTGQHLRLEWAPTWRQGIRPVVREVTVK